MLKKLFIYTITVLAVAVPVWFLAGSKNQKIVMYSVFVGYMVILPYVIGGKKDS